MRLYEILSYPYREYGAVFVVTDAALIIETFCDGTENILPQIAEKQRLDSIMDLAGIDEYEGLRYPMTDTGVSGGREYFVSVCPANDGGKVNYVFFIAAAEGAEQYLSMKTAALSMFFGKGETGFPGTRFEACLRLSAVLGDKRGAASFVRQLYSESFSYYCRLRYKDDRTRYELYCEKEAMMLKKAGVAASMILFHLCLMLSSNSYVRVSLTESGGVTDVRMSFSPGRKVTCAISSGSSVLSALYRALGSNSAELYFVKTLVDGFECGPDEETKEIYIRLRMDCHNDIRLRSNGVIFSTTAFAAVDYILNGSDI